MFLLNGKKIKIVMCLGLSVLMFTAQPCFCVKADTVQGGTPVAGISSVLNDFYSNDSMDASEKASVLTADYNIPENIAIANVNNQLNIRSGAATKYDRVGLLDKGDACIINEIVVNDAGEKWAKITSDTITGYVFYDYLFTDKEAVNYVKENYTACVKVQKSVTNLNIRSSASTNSDIISKAKGDTTLKIANDCIINKEDSNKVWVEVEYEKGKTGFVCAEFVDFTYDIPWAEKYTPYGPGVSDKRCNICDYAKKYIGLKYVWGGESLTSGCDCSGFVRAIYKHFGYSLERTSYNMASSLTKISKEELQPGDLIFYGKLKGQVNHVAMYIGNGQIIHNSSNNTKYYKKGDVEITSMYFYNSEGGTYGIKKYCRVLGKNE